MRYLLNIVFLLLTFHCFSQEMDSTKIDTSDYIPGEPDINLLIAADKGYASEVIRLLDQGANIKYATFDGVTALMYAAQRGHKKVVQILLEKGSNPNKKPNDGNSALHGAVMFNNIDVAEILIKEGANVDLKNKKGVTPLMIAAGYDYFIMTDLLLFYGANVYIKDDNGNDALLAATYHENTEIIDLLLTSGSDVNTSDRKGFTPLMIATQYNNETLVELFLDYGANINLQNAFGYSALTYAIVNGNKKLVEKFIDAGANVNIFIDYSTTPLTLARQTGYDSIKQLLLENGAKRNPYPDFSDVNIGPHGIFNTSDFRLGVSFQLNESKYKLNMLSSYEIRPSRKRVLREREDNVFYQFWETRHIITAGLQRTFIFSKENPERFYGLHLTAKAGHTFGGYRGYAQNATSKTFFIPEAGLSVVRPKSIFKLSYAYMPFDKNNIGPHQIKIEYLFTIFLNNKRYKNKSIKWLE